MKIARQGCGLMRAAPHFKPKQHTSSPVKKAGFIMGIGIIMLLGACSQDAIPTAPDILEPARVSELPRPGSLKSRVEGYARYDGEPAYSCGGKVGDLKPGPRAFRTYLAKFDITANTYYLCQRGFHPVGQALDIFTSGFSEKQAFADWLTANNDEMAKRLGIVQIIWNKRIWLSYTSRPGTWHSYRGSDPHTSHLHLSFGSAGASGSTSFFREVIGSLPSPCTLTWPTVKENNLYLTRTHMIQYLLRSRGYIHLVADGKFGPNTTRTVQAFQRRVGLKDDGVVGKNTWLKLIKTVRLGERGDDTRAVQLPLKVTPRDGVFGSQTLAAVKAYQQRKGLTADGVVGANTWAEMVGGNGCR